jgi:hypothetical protein
MKQTITTRWNPLTHYSMAELEYFIFDGIVPAHCTRCGHHEGDYEPDYRDGVCERCGGEVESVTEILMGLF